MPLFTIAEALYGSSSGPFASDINVLCLISGVSAPVPILTKTGQKLLLTTVHIGDDERGTTRDSSSVSTSSSSLINASLNKKASGAGAIVEIGDDINPNVGTLTYWGGLAAESKLLVPRKASPHTSHMLQSTTSLRTGDIVLILHVARRVWMNKSTLQVRDGQSKIYILSRQDERMQQRLVRKKISAVEEGEDEDDNVTLTIDQRKELRSLLSPSDSCFLLDDIAGKQRIERLFALSRREEPLITSATLFHQSSLYTGKGLIGDRRGGGGGSLVHVGFSTQLDGGFSEEPHPFVRKSNVGDGGGGGGYVEESQILPFDIDSSGATRAMSLQLSAPVSRPALPKTTPPPQAANSAAVSSPLITSCSKIPLATGILFNISCSIRSFLRSALPVQASSVGVHSAPTTASAAAPIAVVPLSRGEDLRNNHNKHSLIELGRASLVLPQSRSQPLALSIVYCLDPQFRLATGSNVSAPTPTLAEHLCDLFFKSFTGKEKVIISNCLQRDGLIYVTSLSDVMCDSYDEDEEAFNAAHAASQRLAKQLQLQESNPRKRPRDEFSSKSPIPVTSSSSSSSSSADVVDGSSVVDDTRKMKRTLQGKFAVTSVYLPALQLGVQQLLSEGCAFVTDLLSVPVTKVKVNDVNDASLTLQPECNLLTEESLIDKLAFLIDTCMPSALSSSKVDAIYHPIWLKVLHEKEEDLPLLSKEASKEEDKKEIKVARPISGWIEFNQKFVQQLLAGLPATSIAKCVGEVNDDNKNEKVIVDKGEEEFMIMKRRKIIASSIYELLVSLMHNDSRISLVIETNKEDEGMDNNNDVIGKLSSFST